MTEHVLWSIYYLVYTVELFLIGEGIFHNRVREKAKYITMTGVCLSVVILTVLFFNNNVFIIMALNMVMYIVLFQGNAVSQIVHFGGVYLLTNMTENIIFGIGVFLLAPSLNHLEMNAVWSGAVSLLFAVIVTGVILYIVTRKWTQNFIAYFRTLNWFQYLVIIITVWSGILLLGNVTAGYIENKKAGALFALTAIFMGTAFIGVALLVLNAYSKDYYFRQNRIKEEIIHIQQMYFQNIFDNDREMRSFRHDINSQLGCLQLLLADGKTKEALEHLQIIGNHFEELTIQKCHTGSELLDVIINQKIQDAKKKGINIEISIEIEGKMDRLDFMDTYDLCTLFSNMLSNSIEACEAIQDREGLIMVSILTHRNTVLFRFTNPATLEMYKALRKGNTTKKDSQNHGFGMENVQRVVKKNKGEMECFFRDGKLTIEMYFEV